MQQAGHGVHPEPDLLRFATAGSVDDGKSTLIGRLLHDAGALYEDHLHALRKPGQDGLDFSLVTDGLRAEREQAITIDVAYRYFATPRRRFIIADTPGHVQYTRNMATGASTADVAVVLVDAALGVQVQSKRHAFIASLLGVPRMVVAINKMDLVGFRQEVFEAIREEYEAFAARLHFTDLQFIPVCALEGDNVVRRSDRMPWFEGPALLSYLETVYIGGDANLIDFRFPVQRVVRPNAEFRGYSGQISSGVVREGDEIVALPSGRRSRVRRIVTADGDLPYAFPPMAVTLCLEDDLDIARGDLLAHPNNAPAVERSLEAMLVWVGDRPLTTGATYLIKHTTSAIKGSCHRISYRIEPGSGHRQTTASLEMNDIGRVSLTLFKPLMLDAYAKNRATGSFIMIDPVSRATAAAGMVIERRSARTSAEDIESFATRSNNIGWEPTSVTATERAAMLRQQPMTVWLTGLSAAGKSTIARSLEHELIAAGHACCVVDGDNLRHGLCRDLGFAPEDRRENIRRAAEVANLFNNAGLIAIIALISPYAEDRAVARQIVGAQRFVEVYVEASLEACERRDPKGLYAKARAGEIEGFTGVSAPYEAPPRPDVRLDAEKASPQECVQTLLAFLLPRIRS